MTQEIMDSITKAIEANLPATVGKTLKDRLAKADADEELVNSLQAKLSYRANQVSELQRDLDLAKSQLKTHKDLDDRQLELEAKERNMEVAILKVRLEEAHASKDFARHVALGLVKNPIFKESIYETGNTMEPVTNSGYTSLQPASKSATRTVERSTE